MRLLGMSAGIALGVAVLTAAAGAIDYLVDSQENCIDLGSTCENLENKVVRLQTYRSVSYLLTIFEPHDPVTYNSAGDEFEGVFVGGPVGAAGSESWTWWHRTVLPGRDLHLPVTDRHLNVSLFMADVGNLTDNEGRFVVKLMPTAWGDLPDLPEPEGLWAAKGIVNPETGKIYVFGGGRYGSHYTNVTRVIDPECPGDWDEIPASPDGPGVRYHHSAIYDPNPGDHPRMVIFGGMCPQTKYNDTWALDLETEVWSPIGGPVEVPPPCNYHVAIYDPVGGDNPRMLVRGGHELGDSTYALDLTTEVWTLIENGGGPSGGRAQSGAAFYNPEGGPPQFLIFGGGYLSVYYNDLWSLDLTTMAWTERPNHGGVGLPTPRQGHAMVIDPIREKLVVFGGRDATHTWDDIWCYDLVTESWGYWGYPNNGWPEPLTFCASAYDVAHQAFILAGGVQVGGSGPAPAPVKVFIADFESVFYRIDPAAAGDYAQPMVNRIAASAWPIPVVGSVTIQYELPERASVKVSIVDTSGRLVKTLENATKPAGIHRVYWNGRTDEGTTLPRGVYFCRIRAGSAQTVRRIVTVD